MRASFVYHPLTFKRPAGTSRGVLHVKHSWILTLEEDGIKGIGECSIIPDLSADYFSNEAYENELQILCDGINAGSIRPNNWGDLYRNQSSILFGLECAYLDLQNGGKQIYFDNAFSHGEKQIPINGLIWMGDETFMAEQIEEKLKAGFSTIKMKIGAIDWVTEHKLLQSIRTRFSEDQITLRVDANGGFTPEAAPALLQQLADLSIHSIEQPIKQKQWDEMAHLCEQTPCPIALDEELIGVNDYHQKMELLNSIQPQYIILKPCLHGGIQGCREWISLAEARNIPWWMTSALESNIGLKAICEFTAEYNNDLPQGLGTGSLYETNFPSQLTVQKGHIFWNI